MYSGNVECLYLSVFILWRGGCVCGRASFLPSFLGRFENKNTKVEIKHRQNNTLNIYVRRLQNSYSHQYLQEEGLKIKPLIWYPQIRCTLAEFTPQDKAGLSIHPTHMATHITCDQTVSDTPSIIEHESIFQCHTHTCCTYRVCRCTARVLYHSTMSVHPGICLHCTHICHTYHRTSRLHLSLHETGDPCPHPGATRRGDNATGSQIVVNPAS